MFALVQVADLQQREGLTGLSSPTLHKMEWNSFWRSIFNFLVGLQYIYKLSSRIAGELIYKLQRLFLIARLARSDPRNRFSVQKKSLLCHLLNFSVFHHVFISSLDMFENCINSYHIDSEQVQTCLRIIWIITIRIILNLNKFRHVTTCSDMFENHINSYQIDS